MSFHSPRQMIILYSQLICFWHKNYLNSTEEKIEEKNSIHPNDKQHKTLDLQRIGSLSSSGGGDSENERYQS